VLRHVYLAEKRGKERVTSTEAPSGLQITTCACPFLQHRVYRVYKCFNGRSVPIGGVVRTVTLSDGRKVSEVRSKEALRLLREAEEDIEKMNQ